MKLRAVEPEDARMMFKADNDEECRLYSDYCAPLSLAQLEDYARNYDADPFRSGQLRLIIEADSAENTGDNNQPNELLNSSYRPVGILDIYDISLRDSRAFVGIYILPEFRHKGLALKALQLLSAYAPEHLYIERLVAKIPAGNIPSLKLFEKAGYKEEVVLRRWKRIGRTLSDIHLLIKTL